MSQQQPLEDAEDDDHGNSGKPVVCNCKKTVHLIYEYMYNVLFLLCLTDTDVQDVGSSFVKPTAHMQSETAKISDYVIEYHLKKMEFLHKGA